MTIQLIIHAESSTNMIAEVQNLAAALGVQPEFKATSSDDAPTTVSPSGTKPEVEAKPKKLSAKQQDAKVKEIIEKGEPVDEETLALFTKARQKQITDALAEPAEKPAETAAEETQEATEDVNSVEDMFGDEPAQETVEVTIDMIRDMMQKVGTNDEGLPDQAKLLKVRSCLEAVVPEGEQATVSNIPEDKYVEVYDAIAKVA